MITPTAQRPGSRRLPAAYLARAQPVDFVGCAGQLGMFAWMRNNQPPEPPAKWMLPKTAPLRTLTAEKTGTLL